MAGVIELLNRVRMFTGSIEEETVKTLLAAAAVMVAIWSFLGKWRQDYNVRKRLQIVSGTLALTTLIRYQRDRNAVMEEFAARRREFSDLRGEARRIGDEALDLKPWMEYMHRPFLFSNLEGIDFRGVNFLLQGRWFGLCTPPLPVLVNLINAEEKNQELKLSLRLYNDAVESMLDKCRAAKVSFSGPDFVAKVEEAAGDLVIAQVVKSLNLVWELLSADAELYKDAYKGLREDMVNRFRFLWRRAAIIDLDFPVPDLANQAVLHSGSLVIPDRRND